MMVTKDEGRFWLVNDKDIAGKTSDRDPWTIPWESITIMFWSKAGNCLQWRCRSLDKAQAFIVSVCMCASCVPGGDALGVIRQELPYKWVVVYVLGNVRFWSCREKNKPWYMLSAIPFNRSTFQYELQRTKPLPWFDCFTMYGTIR